MSDEPIIEPTSSTTPEAAPSEALEFRTEVQQLLNILAHSLYTERAIFLRELVSNASDALHRMQFQMLTDRNVADPDTELAIHIDADEKARTLTVADSGIGMTREELVENLGTIAHSGAMAFLKELEEGKRPADIIGQFGVGFYAVFMVADEVVVTSRSYQPDATAWRWVSTGGNQFTLNPTDKPHRGTTIEIKLKEDAAEFTAAWRLEQIIRRHSNYVSFPIYVGEKVVNQQNAPWRKPMREMQESDYTDFYRQLTLDTEPPLLHVHLITDAPVDIRSILFVPHQLDRGPLAQRADYGLRLYSRKILIQERTKDLLPEYLRFVEGVVDSEDVPLNVSRETVQSSRAMQQIQKVLVDRLLKALAQLVTEKPADYATFWREYGAFIKQGVVTAPANRDQLLPLLRFQSSKSGSDVISLADYAARMPAEQTAIYYILGNDAGSVGQSPHLDAFRAHNLEVLYLLDPFDGLTMQSVREYEGKPLQNVDDPTLELPQTPGPEPDQNQEAAPAAAPADVTQLAARVKTVLGDRVGEVRESRLLTDSPSRLVSQDDGYDRDLERVRRLLEQDFRAQPKILELNPRHPLIRNLARLVAENPTAPLIDPAIEQLYENLLLLEGLHPNPANMVPRLQQLLEAATAAPSVAAASGDASASAPTDTAASTTSEASV
jgi:molecular chaperone HtpG